MLVFVTVVACGLAFEAEDCTTCGAVPRTLRLFDVEAMFASTNSKFDCVVMTAICERRSFYETGAVSPHVMPFADDVHAGRHR